MKCLENGVRFLLVNFWKNKFIFCESDRKHNLKLKSFTFSLIITLQIDISLKKIYIYFCTFQNIALCILCKNCFLQSLYVFLTTIILLGQVIIVIEAISVNVTVLSHHLYI